MADQATLNPPRKPKRHEPGPSLRKSVTAFSHDVIELAELQFALFVADLRSAKQSMAVPALLMIGGAAVLLGCIPVGLTAISFLLIEGFGWSNGLSFLGVSVVAALLALGLAYAGWKQAQSGLDVLGRSQEELKENIRSIKLALREGYSDADEDQPPRAPKSRY